MTQAVLSRARVLLRHGCSRQSVPFSSAGRLVWGRRPLLGLPLPLAVTSSSPRRSLHVSHGNRTYRRTFLYASGGIAGISFFLGMHVHCRSNTELAHAEESSDIPPPSTLPTITLYQYQTCPYCSKTRAFLDYYGVPYSVVEVNPVFRKEVKEFEYKKLPFIVVDGLQVGDSNLITSVLRTCMLTGQRSIPAILQCYPEVTHTDAKGKTQSERANKYFIMFGEEGDKTGTSIGERREEREWREWVDKKLLRCIPPNIYRTFPEALRTFDNITRLGNFGTFQRLVGKYIGAIGMYFMGKSLKKKYHLDPDVRQTLYGFCEEWVGAVGKHRRYMGGNEPNLADLAMFGALNAIEGLDTFTDVIENTRVGPWYWEMKNEVSEKRGRTRWSR